MKRAIFAGVVIFLGALGGLAWTSLTDRQGTTAGSTVDSNETNRHLAQERAQYSRADSARRLILRTQILNQYAMVDRATLDPDLRSFLDSLNQP